MDRLPVGPHLAHALHAIQDVIEPTDPERLPQRTNNLMFVFAASRARRRTVLPTTYPEVRMSGAEPKEAVYTQQ